jgi:hypothetical protein
MFNFLSKSKNIKPLLKMTYEEYQESILGVVKEIITKNTSHELSNVSEIKSIHSGWVEYSDFYIEIEKENFKYDKKYFENMNPIIPIKIIEDEGKSYFVFSPRFNGFGEAMCMFIDMNEYTPIIDKIEYEIPKSAKLFTVQRQRLSFYNKDLTFSGMTLAVNYKDEYRKMVVLTESYTEKNKFYCLKEIIYGTEKELMDNYKDEAFKTLCNYPETRYLKSLDLEYICKNVYEMPLGER